MLGGIKNVTQNKPQTNKELYRPTEKVNTDATQIVILMERQGFMGQLQSKCLDHILSVH